MTQKELLELQHRIMTVISDKVDDLNRDVKMSDIIVDTAHMYKRGMATGALSVMAEVSQVFLDLFDQLEEVEDHV